MPSTLTLVILIEDKTEMCRSIPVNYNISLAESLDSGNNVWAPEQSWFNSYRVYSFQEQSSVKVTERRHTWIVKGVSFFLLIVLSSIVSGTDRLIILLKEIQLD